jgi:hypothetical protein
MAVSDHNEGTIYWIERAYKDTEYQVNYHPSARNKYQAISAIYEQVKDFHTRADILVKEIDTTILRLIKDTGGLKEDGNYAEPESKKGVAKSLIENGEIQSLLKRVDKLSQHFRSDSSGNFTYVNSRTSEADFEDATLVAAVDLLLNMQAHIKCFEAQHLEHSKKQIEDIQGREFVFDRLQPVVTVEKDKVVNGDTYRAQMYMVRMANKLKQTMTANGDTIEVVNGVGQVKFIASRPGKKTWKGSITVETPSRDTTFIIEEPYIVVPRK